MKHRYLSVIATALLFLPLATVPVSSFAASPNRDLAGDREHASIANTFSANWFGFGNRIALADSSTGHTEASKNLAPVISGVSAPTVLSTDVSGTWTVNASDPENGTLSYAVDWGDRGMLRSFLFPETLFTQTGTFTHSYENPGTFTVKFTVKDGGGRTAASSVTVHVTKEKGEKTIAIASVTARSTDATTARVSWSTNRPADSIVYYGTTSPLDLATAESVHVGNRVLSHLITLDELTESATYYYVVQSTDARGATATSSESSFTTPAASTENGTPSIKSVNGPSTLTEDTEGTWTVNASDPENGTLSYAVDWGDVSTFGRIMALVVPKAFTQTSTFTHSYANTGTYTVTFTVKDADGLSATHTSTVTVSATPTISGLTALLSNTGVTFSWNTDVAADSAVHYSASSPVVVGNADTSVVSDGTLGTSHSLGVKNLSANTAYHFLIESKDADGGVGSTSEFGLTTMSL